MEASQFYTITFKKAKVPQTPEEFEKEDFKREISKLQMKNATLKTQLCEKDAAIFKQESSYIKIEQMLMEKTRQANDFEAQVEQLNRRLESFENDKEDQMRKFFRAVRNFEEMKSRAKDAQNLLKAVFDNLNTVTEQRDMRVASLEDGLKLQLEYIDDLKKLLKEHDVICGRDYRHLNAPPDETDSEDEEEEELKELQTQVQERPEGRPGNSFLVANQLTREANTIADEFQELECEEIVGVWENEEQENWDSENSLATEMIFNQNDSNERNKKSKKKNKRRYETILSFGIWEFLQLNVKFI